MGSTSYSIRPQTPDDEQSVYLLCRRIDPPEWDYDLAVFTHWQEMSRRFGAAEHLVATDAAGHIVGMGAVSIGPERPWGCYIEVGVAPEARSRGIGGALFRELEAWATAHGATLFRAWPCSKEPETRPFYERRGFVVTEEERVAVLDLTRFDPAAWRDKESAGVADGVLFVTLADAGCPTRSEIPTLMNAANQSMPSALEHRDEADEPVLFRVLESPYYSPDLALFAKVGEQWAGMCWVLPTGHESAMLECTAVFEPFRRRGIAWTLKLRTTRWAKDLGLRSLVTCNDSGNEGMLHINARMGFEYRLTQLGMQRGEDRPPGPPCG